MKVGYLGPTGTFTKMAVNEIFPKEEAVPFPTIPACFDAIYADDVDYVVVPLENTIEGSVNLTVDYLIHKTGLSIIGEVIVPIKQHLMVHPNNKDKWQDIKVVYSHSHALAQCHQFLHDEMPNVKQEFKNSTAAAAEYVHNTPDELIGAIGNTLAAKEYELEIVKENIHDYDNNHTRFVVLHKSTIPMDTHRSNYRGDRTTLMISLPSDYSGALHQVLSAFAWRRINLSKIESRPMKTGLGNYYFIIDVEMRLDDVLLPNAIKELEAIGCTVRMLGTYPYFLANVE